MKKRRNLPFHGVDSSFLPDRLIVIPFGYPQLSFSIILFLFFRHVPESDHEVDDDDNDDDDDDDGQNKEEGAEGKGKSWTVF